MPGLLTSAGCYVVAASLYPGGVQFRWTQSGYSHLRNYLCDLFDARPFGHPENPGRPFGIAALALLSLSLLPLSLSLPGLMHRPSLARRSVPILGSIASVSGCLVFTSLHDAALQVAFFPLLLAFLLCLFELQRNHYSHLAVLGLWPLSLGSLNFALWKFELLVIFIPLVQKLAILGFMFWAGMVAMVVQSRRM